MKQWIVYGAVFLLGALSAIVLYPRPPKQAAISDWSASISATPVKKEETATVAGVIDGDTIELVDRRRIRYIGIDTPEMGDFRRQVACFAKEATQENRRLVEGKTVQLKKDVSETDRYGRLLRYVYIGDVFVNDHLVRQGAARVATFPPDVAYKQEFLSAEREARKEGRGLWGKCQ